MIVVLKPQSRKSIGLYPLPGGVLEVRHPYGMPRSAIDAFLEKHRTWAEEAVRRKNEEAEARIDRSSLLPFLGRDYPILEPKNGKVGFYPDIGFRLPDENMAEHALRIYRMAAKEILPKKTAVIAARMGLGYSSVKITSARTRWGSCSGKNSINFSLYLITAPEAAVDYVIIHELAHTVHHDHSPSFWAMVMRWCPDYEKRKAELNECARRRRELGL